MNNTRPLYTEFTTCFDADDNWVALYKYATREAAAANLEFLKDTFFNAVSVEQDGCFVRVVMKTNHFECPTAVQFAP